MNRMSDWDKAITQKQRKANERRKRSVMRLIAERDYWRGVAAFYRDEYEASGIYRQRQELREMESQRNFTYSIWLKSENRK